MFLFGALDQAALLILNVMECTFSQQWWMDWTFEETPLYKAFTIDKLHFEQGIFVDYVYLFNLVYQAFAFTLPLVYGEWDLFTFWVEIPRFFSAIVKALELTFTED